jgi:hypothetical protein
MSLYRRRACSQALTGFEICAQGRYAEHKASKPREQIENYGRACTQVLFLHKAELRFFHFLKIVTGSLVPSAGQKIPG